MTARDARIDQIERATSSARPKHDNPSWLNTHNNLTYVLARYRELEAQIASPAPVFDMDAAVEAIYYMRDNHTFKRLTNNVEIALIEIEAEFNAGHTYGMLCSKRHGFTSIHANGSAKRLEFFGKCRVALAEIMPTTSPDMDALRRDAERYRWIRDKAELLDNFEYWLPSVLAIDFKPAGELNSQHQTLDAAIDAQTERSDVGASTACDTATEGGG